MLGKLIFADFLFSLAGESCFSLIFEFPPWGKVVFRRILSFPRSGKAIFAEFYSSYPYESLLFPFFARRTPTKASFSRFLLVVPLRKSPFPVFRPSYPYESLFFPFSARRTPTKAYFFCFSSIVPRIWVVFSRKSMIQPYMQIATSSFLSSTNYFTLFTTKNFLFVCISNRIL